MRLRGNWITTDRYWRRVGSLTKNEKKKNRNITDGAPNTMATNEIFRFDHGIFQ